MKREELIEAIFTNMQQMHRSGAAKMQAMVSQQDISVSQMELLMIVKHRQPISAKAIAMQMQLTPGAVTQLVEALVVKGFLDRREDEHDRRITNISLSEGGKQKLTNLYEQRMRVMKEIVDSLEDNELSVFLRVQDKIRQHVEVPLPNIKSKETK